MNFFYKLAQAGQDAYFRRIEFYDEERDRVLVFLTNHLELAAATVAAIYKERWQIDPFFRALKQSLRVRTFVGTSASVIALVFWPTPTPQNQRPQMQSNPGKACAERSKGLPDFYYEAVLERVRPPDWKKLLVRIIVGGERKLALWTDGDKF